jgi:hypothetical protein
MAGRRHSYPRAPRRLRPLDRARLHRGLRLTPRTVRAGLSHRAPCRQLRRTRSTRRSSACSLPPLRRNQSGRAWLQTDQLCARRHLDPARPYRPGMRRTRPVEARHRGGYRPAQCHPVLCHPAAVCHPALCRLGECLRGYGRPLRSDRRLGPRAHPATRRRSAAPPKRRSDAATGPRHRRNASVSVALRTATETPPSSWPSLRSRDT